MREEKKERIEILAKKIVDEVKHIDYVTNLFVVSEYLHTDKTDIDAIKYKRNILNKIKKSKKIILNFNKLLKEDKGNSLLLNAKGELFIRIGEYQKAIDCFNQVLSNNTSNVDSLIGNGKAFVNAGKQELGIMFYDKALEYDKDNIKALNEKGLALSQLKEYKKSINCFDIILELDKNNTIALNNKGSVLMQFEKYEEAAACFDKILLEIDKNDITMLINEAKFSLLYSRFDAAIEYCNKVLRIDSNNLSAKKYKKLAIKKNNEKIIYELKLTARFYFSNKNYGAAIECLCEIPFNKINQCVDLFITNMEENTTLNIIIDELVKYNNAWNEYPTFVKENKEVKRLIILERILLYFISLKKDDAIDEIAHYGRIGILEKIITVDKDLETSPLRMQTISKANDISEGSILLNVIKKNTDKQIDNSINDDSSIAFQTSFTRCIDSLTMFRLYGKEEGRESEGFSLVFNKNFFEIDFSLSEPAKVTYKDFNKSNKVNKKLPLFFILYYDENTNQLVYNPYKSKYKKIIIDLDNIDKEDINWKYPKNRSYIFDDRETPYNKTTYGYSDKNYKYVINNIRYLFKEIFSILKADENKSIVDYLYVYGLSNLRYLIKHSEFSEEQELRILQVLNPKKYEDKIYYDISSKATYKNYLKVTEYDSLKKIILGSKVENVNAIKEMWRLYFAKHPKVYSSGIEIQVSKAPLR